MGEILLREPSSGSSANLVRYEQGELLVREPSSGSSANLVRHELGELFSSRTWFGQFGELSSS